MFMPTLLNVKRFRSGPAPEKQSPRLDHSCSRNMDHPLSGSRNASRGSYSFRSLAFEEADGSRVKPRSWARFNLVR